MRHATLSTTGDQRRPPESANPTAGIIGLVTNGTGHIAALVLAGQHRDDGWMPGVDPDEHAPRRATIHAAALAHLPRTRDVVTLPGGSRWAVGLPHPRRPFAVYLHRL